jgi:glycosyltransferase involved in cell wall biosynthesis
MRVCHVTSVHPYNDNRIFYKEILTLKRAGYDVCYIAPNAPAEFEGVSIYTNKFSGGRLKRFIYQAFWKTFGHAIKAKAQVYHFHDPELMPTAFLLRLIGKKIVFDVHENTPAAILSKPYLKAKWLRKCLSLAIDLTEKIHFFFFNQIITARPDISDRLKRFKPYTLRNFPILPSESELEEQLIDQTISKVKKAVIYVGGMSLIRGNLELIEAFENLNEYELWLLGPFKSQEFEQKCRASAGWKNVRYLGVVEPHQIFGYIQQADVGIVTFWPEPNHLRTLATKPFEYMACGLPLVMSGFPYWREFFGDSSVYVDPKDPNSIANGIRNLFGQEELMKSMASDNKEMSRIEYNWDSEKNELLRMYKTLEK